MSKLQKQQLEEWFDSDVTRHFVKLVRKRLDETYAMRAQVFFPGEPYKTQEGKATLLGAESILGDLVEAFQEKDLSYFEEEESSDEQVGHSPERRPGTH